MRRGRKRKVLLGAAVGSLATVAVIMGLRTAKESGIPSVGPGTRAPDFRAVTLDTPSVARTLEDYAGEVVLLNIWATWCAPCIEEMPSMQALHEQFADRGLRIVAISVDDRGREALIREFVKEYELTFEVLHDPESRIMNGYRLYGLPQTFLIDTAGVIHLRRYAADWTSRDNREAVEAVLPH